MLSSCKTHLNKIPIITTVHDVHDVISIVIENTVIGGIFSEREHGLNLANFCVHSSLETDTSFVTTTTTTQLCFHLSFKSITVSCDVEKTIKTEEEINYL